MSIWSRFFLDAWARAHRNARALGAALALFAGIGLMGIVKCQEAADPVVDDRRETGFLVKTEPGLSEATVLGTVALDSGDTVQLFLVAPYPEPGTRIPLRAEVRRSGDRVYRFDAAAHLTGQ